MGNPYLDLKNPHEYDRERRVFSVEQDLKTAIESAIESLDDALVAASKMEDSAELEEEIKEAATAVAAMQQAMMDRYGWEPEETNPVIPS